MFFTYSAAWDATAPLQRQGGEGPLWKRADDRFFWNKYLQSRLIELASKGQAEAVSLPPPLCIQGPRLTPANAVRPLYHPRRLRLYVRVDPTGVADDADILFFAVFEIKTAKINSHVISFGLVSRRSRHRAGTRYFSRGIDSHGNVSNFNETEMLVFAQNGQVRASFVQTRGSVPVYWTEINNLRYKPDLQIMELEATVSPGPGSLARMPC